jgi:hypothetical protein
MTPSQKRMLRDFNRFNEILFFIFVTLKLAQVGEVQHWSWYYVTLPLWFPAAIFLTAWIIVSMIIFFLKLIPKN